MYLLYVCMYSEEFYIELLIVIVPCRKCDFWKFHLFTSYPKLTLTCVDLHFNIMSFHLCILYIGIVVSYLNILLVLLTVNFDGGRMLHSGACDIVFIYTWSLHLHLFSFYWWKILFCMNFVCAFLFDSVGLNRDSLHYLLHMLALRWRTNLCIVSWQLLIVSVTCIVSDICFLDFLLNFVLFLFVPVMDHTDVLLFNVFVCSP
jgi:hypothetical protein